MSNLQVKNVPEHLHQRLRRYAKARRRTLANVVLDALARELTRGEWHERLAGRPTSELGASAASLLDEERREQERNLS